MKLTIAFAMVLFAFTALTIGCSGHNAGIDNPVIPDRAEWDGWDGTPWGIYDIYVDVDNNQVTITESRNAVPHFNVTDYILPPLCPDCVSGSIIGFNPVSRVMTLEISLKNDTDYLAYDVRGILLITDETGHDIANPDGYTKRFDDSNPKDINPFILWKNGGDEWEFPPHTTLAEEVQIVMPTPMSFAVQFVVEAAFPDHSRDAIQFEEITLDGDIHDTGWLVDVSLKVFDWQDDVSYVYVDLCPAQTGVGEYPLALDVDGCWKGQIQYHPDQGVPLPELGTHRVRLRAVDSTVKANLYDFVEVEVTEDNAPPQWVDHVGISDLAVGAGRAVVYHDIAVDPSAEVEYYLYYSDSASPYDGDYITVTGAAHYAITGLTNGVEYVFGVRAGDQAGNVDENFNYRIGTPQAIQLLWARTVASEINSNPNLADLDADNDLDVVFGSDDGRVIALDGLTGDVGWHLMTGGSVVGSPALVDINLDALPDVVIGSGDGKLYGIRGTNGSDLGSFQTQNIIESSPVVCDYDGNGTPEVFIGSTDEKVYGISIFTLTHFATYDAGSPVIGTPCLAYLNSDEYPDVILGAGGTVAAVNGTDATDLWSVSIGFSALTGSPAMACFNGDTISDLVIGTPAGVYVLDGTDGSTVWSRTDLGVDFETDPALADLNGDSTPDVVISGRVQGIYAFNGADGSVMWQAEGNPVVPTSPAIADVTGDGKLDVIAGASDLYLRIYNSDDGLILGQYPTSLAGRITTTPAVGDVNHDGYIDIVFGTEERTMFAITTNEPMPGSTNLLPWPRFHRNQLNQGNLGAPLVPNW